MTITDILMITYRRPHYLRRSLPALLDSCDDTMRLWLWHNGDDLETLGVVRAHLDHPRLHRFHHSSRNVGLNEPTNWMWRSSEGAFVAKVDDDCLVEDGWVQRLRDAHLRDRTLGVIACWRFPDEDFVPELAGRKLRSFAEGSQLLENCWVQGSSYLMKRECIQRAGLLGNGQNFTDYCIDLACLGYTNGFYYPFIREDHMDDPRSPHTALLTDEDLEQHLPLSARRLGIRTLADWELRTKGWARHLQEAPTDPRYFRGWRAKLTRPMRRGLARSMRAVAP